jgi:hypothetical protein
VTFDNDLRITRISINMVDETEPASQTDSGSPAISKPPVVSPKPLTAVSEAARLVIKVASREVSFAGERPSPLTARPFAVFRMLAEAARDGTGPVAKAAIIERLMSNKTLDSAVRDTVRELRKQLQPLGISRRVQTRNNIGYLLDLRPEDIEIQP